MFVWETNGVGQLIGYSEVQYYPVKFHRQSIRQANAKIKAVPGWWTGGTERPEMQKRIEEWGIELYENPERVKDSRLFDELCTLSYNTSKKRYEAQGGKHDDIAFSALGIALVVDRLLSDGGNVPVKVNKDYVLAKKTNRPKGGFALDRVKIPSSL
jgi:hypothetical protein